MVVRIHLVLSTFSCHDAPMDRDPIPLDHVRISLEQVLTKALAELYGKDCYGAPIFPDASRTPPGRARLDHCENGRCVFVRGELQCDLSLSQPAACYWL